MNLDDLIPVFGGDVRQAADVKYLDTEVDGLRTFVVCLAPVWRQSTR